MLHNIKKTNLDEEKIKETKSSQNKELDDFDFSKVIVRKPWGHEYLFYRGNGLAMWILHIKNGSMTSMHCHIDKTTVLIVLSEKVLCSNLKDSHELVEGDCLVIEKGTFHSTKAISEKGAIVMEIEDPEKKTDLLRLKDAYGRELKGYEAQKEMCFDLSEYERVFLSDEKIDLNKKIGNMNLCIKEFNEDSSLKNFLNLHKNSINFVLSGTIKSDLGEYKKGEAFEIKKSENIEGIKTDSPVKLLNISRNIMDFD